MSNLLKLITLWHLNVDRKGGRGNGRPEQILGQELPALAKEVAKVETVRMYAGEKLFSFEFLSLMEFVGKNIFNLFVSVIGICLVILRRFQIPLQTPPPSPGCLLLKQSDQCFGITKSHFRAHWYRS